MRCEFQFFSRYLAHITLISFSQQKPTAQSFYKKCISRIPELAKFNPENMRQKMKNFRTSYTKANDWRKSTGAGLEENDENTIGEQLNKMCPYWNYLEEIFGGKTNLNPVAIYEAGQGFKGEVNEELIINDDIEIDFDFEDGSQNAQSIEGTDMDQSTASDSNQNKSDDNESQLFSLAKRMQTKPASRPTSNNSSALLLQITQMRSDIQEKKLAIEERKLALEERRLDQDFEIKKMELEVRKMEAENTRLQLTQQNRDPN